MLIAMLLVDTVGRRPLLLFGSSITAIAMLVVAAVSVCVSNDGKASSCNELLCCLSPLSQSEMCGSMRPRCDAG